MFLINRKWYSTWAFCAWLRVTLDTKCTSNQFLFIINSGTFYKPQRYFIWYNLHSILIKASEKIMNKTSQQLSPRCCQVKAERCRPTTIYHINIQIIIHISKNRCIWPITYTSSSWIFVSKSNLYENPEQPPPSTDKRKNSPGAATFFNC